MKVLVLSLILLLMTVLQSEADCRVILVCEGTRCRNILVCN